MNGFFALLLVVLLTPLAGLAQSLAGVAQRAADERAAKAKGATTPPAKIYTDKDAVPPPPPPADVVTPIAAGAPAKATTIVNAKGVRNEAYWKDRMRALQSTLAVDLAQLRGSIRSYDEVAISGRGAVGYGKLVEATAEMTRRTASVDNDKRAIVELEDEGRRASVPPAWLSTP